MRSKSGYVENWWVGVVAVNEGRGGWHAEKNGQDQANEEATAGQICTDRKGKTREKRSSVL